MKPLLINTTPDSISGYQIKSYDETHFHLPYHMHDKYEITWIEEGTGSRIIGDHISIFKENDVIILGPMLPHQWQNLSINQNSSAKSISLFFKIDFPSKDFWNQECVKPIKKMLELSHKGLLLKGKTQKKITSKLQNLTSLSFPRGMLMVLEILQDIAESDNYEILASDGYISRKNLDTDRISTITNFISENLDQKITLELLSDLVHLHPNSLNREFKRATGFSVIKYINKVRIGKATRLLTETNMPIIDICYICGFQNISYFNRYFKKNYNCTPSNYRKNRM